MKNLPVTRVEARACNIYIYLVQRTAQRSTERKDRESALSALYDLTLLSDGTLEGLTAFVNSLAGSCSTVLYNDDYTVMKWGVRCVAT